VLDFAHQVPTRYRSAEESSGASRGRRGRGSVRAPSRRFLRHASPGPAPRAIHHCRLRWNGSRHGRAAHRPGEAPKSGLDEASRGDARAPHDEPRAIPRCLVRVLDGIESRKDPDLRLPEAKSGDLLSRFLDGDGAPGTVRAGVHSHPRPSRHQQPQRDHLLADCLLAGGADGGSGSADQLPTREATNGRTPLRAGGSRYPGNDGHLLVLRDGRDRGRRHRNGREDRPAHG